MEEAQWSEDWVDLPLGGCGLKGNGAAAADRCKRFKLLMEAVLTYISPRRPAGAYFHNSDGLDEAGVSVSFNKNDSMGIAYAEAAIARKDAVWGLIGQEFAEKLDRTKGRG